MTSLSGKFINRIRAYFENGVWDILHGEVLPRFTWEPLLASFYVKYIKTNFHNVIRNSLALSLEPAKRLNSGWHRITHRKVILIERKEFFSHYWDNKTYFLSTSGLPTNKRIISIIIIHHPIKHHVWEDLHASFIPEMGNVIAVVLRILFMFKG